MNIIRSLIKYFITGDKAKDDGTYSTQKINNGIKKDINVLYPYGMHANAPTGSFGISFNIQGLAENSAGMVTSAFSRTKNFKEGEVEFGNQNVGSLTYYDENGNITATATGSYTINASDLSINCNTTIDGTLETTDAITTTDVTASGTVTGATITGAVEATTLSVSGTPGVNGTFTTADSPAKTVTVTGGIITSIV